ncbi:MAG: F0F1 ATP synthase subunit gamma [Bifidobacteriaceae bacterium]|jgi:F-type H+-transporting ATPase subunit gamma|nr:F0F1 ATP synthase subunit gamma [Bifidobacteriaceae bacterium]
MSGSQRIYRARIKSTQSLGKIFRAMELIAASRIGRSRRAAERQRPYSAALTRAVALAASHVRGEIRHPLISERPEVKRVALLILAADRGMAGAYTANLLREAEGHAAELEAEGYQVDRYVAGRRAVGYYDFRGVPLARTWLGSSDAPSFAVAKDMASTLLRAFTAPPEAPDAVGGLQVVYTHFKNMVSQSPRVIRLLPLQLVEAEDPDEVVVERETASGQRSEAEVFPLYSFEPSPEGVLDALLPRYVRSRLLDCLLQAAASELAGRQRAMHTATDNADDIVRQYTRLANQARQADITQEISEIVSGADAMAASV